MRNLFICALATLCVGVCSAQKFTYDNIADGDFEQRRVVGVRSMQDGEHYTSIEGTAIVRHSYTDPTEAVTIVPQLGVVVNDYAFSADEQRVLLQENLESIYRHSTTANYYIYHNNRLTPVAPHIAAKRDALFSPDASMVAFSSGNNLYIYWVESGKCRQITRDGEWNRIINGTTDWVYEEEFATTRAFAFSPDSRRLLFVRFDESRVPLYDMMRYDGKLYNEAQSFKYPKAGEPNSVVSLHLYDIRSRRSSLIDTDSDSTKYIQRIGWCSAQKFYYEKRNRRQNRVDVMVVDTKSGAQKSAYSEFNPKYVDLTLFKYTFLGDGDRFVVAEESSSGYMHLYLHSVERGRLGIITSGEWDVASVVAATADRIYYTSCETSPLRRNLYSVRYDGSDKRRLTQGEGTYAIEPSCGVKYFISSFSSAATPLRVDICRGSDGEVVRTLEDNAALKHKIESIALPRKEFFRIPTAHGDSLNAFIMRPEGFDPTRKYPVLMTQYSGPASQQVLDRFSLDWEDALCQRGYIIVCVDGRGTGMRGEAFKKCTYGNLGLLEVEDQIAAARYVASQPFVDSERVGIYGWSYGGFMALGCALKGDGLFKVAISVAPVTSWRYYDSIYTEVYNGLPQDNAAGYDLNSPINFAERLHPRTRLLIMHGTADDNVHFQNAVEMSRALTAKGKMFDMMIYADQNHSMLPDNKREVRNKMVDYCLRNL